MKREKTEIRSEEYRRGRCDVEIYEWFVDGQCLEWIHGHRCLSVGS